MERRLPAARGIAPHRVQTMNLAWWLPVIFAGAMSFSYPGGVVGQPVADTPLEVVERHLKAVAAMDPEAIQNELAKDYSLVDTDGSARPYDRKLAMDICGWEKAMRTKWTHEVLGADGNVVTVLSKERSAYFDRLGLGAGVQVEQFTVENGKIVRSVSTLFITERGNQSREFRRFARWLKEQDGVQEPDLIRPDGSLMFDGKSGPRMLYWLERWSDAAPARERKPGGENQ